jgi:hypothetical protein
MDRGGIRLSDAGRERLRRYRSGDAAPNERPSMPQGNNRSGGDRKLRRSTTPARYD